MLRLLACLDLTDADAAVLATVRRWKERVPLHVRLLHVAATEPAFVGFDPPGGPHDRDRRAAELRAERDHLDQLVAALQQEGVDTSRALVQGSVADVIVAEAHHHDADAILLGGRQHSRLHRLLAGDILKSVLGATDRPVVVAERPGAPPVRSGTR